MIEKPTTVYYCEHCNKKGFYKATIKKHEETCFGNPDNVPACFKWVDDIPSKCEHLVKNSEHGFYYCSNYKRVLHTKRSEVMKYPIPEDSLLMPKHCFAYQPDIEILHQEPAF